MEMGSGLRGTASHSGRVTGRNLISSRGQAVPVFFADSTKALCRRAAAHSRSVGCKLS